MIDVIYILGFLLTITLTFAAYLTNKLINYNNKSKMSHKFSKEDKQSIEQAALEAAQQAAQQIVQGVGQDKVTGYDSNKHDIDTDEAHKSAVLSVTRQWNWNDKALAELELAKKQHDFSIQQQLDHIKVINAQELAVFNKASNHDLAKFGYAQSEPISPDTGSDEKDADK